VRIKKFFDRRPVASGLVMIAVAVVGAALVLNKPAIVTHLKPGQTITVELARDYKIEPYGTDVKLAGTKIGTVESLSKAHNGTVAMVLKVNNGTDELLGSAPSAEVRPTTLLGGHYYVCLVPGGDRGTFAGATIPTDRTKLPVELDTMLSAIPPPAQQGLQHTMQRLDATLAAGTGERLDQLAEDAPATLRPLGATVDAMRGLNVDTDLLLLVRNLDSTARVLSQQPGQLTATVDSFARVSRAFGDNAEPVDRTIAELPDTLRATRRGTDALSVSLDKLTNTAHAARPTVERLDPVLRELEPTLADLRPVAADLHPLLEDAKPVIEELTPTVEDGTEVFTDLHGKVMDRVTGPILGSLTSRWTGLAPKYPGGGDGNIFYQEIPYMFSHLDDIVRYQTASSHLLGFNVDVGSTSLEGDGPGAQRLQDYLTQMYGPDYVSPPTQIPPGASSMKIVPPDPGPSPFVPDLGLGKGTK
jgi:phospholipid/cholesterol/gamma-HCH transport system substrate-binding protein